MKRSLSKKAQKVMQKMMEEAQIEHPLAVLSKIKARMMLQAALEDKAGRSSSNRGALP